MTSYLYNGIELPALPETDKPYAVIFRGVTGAYYLKLSDTAITTDSDGNAVNPQYIANGTESWSENTVITVTGEVIWANYDVYTTDGTLYLSATDPVPVGNPITDPVSFMMGYQLGCRLRAQRGAKKPIGYSYNGVVLPELPQWDKEKYPYAWIHQFNTANPSYVLRIASEPIVYKKPIFKDYYVYSMTGAGCIYNINDGAWEIFQSDVTFDNYFPESDVLFSWTNTDIINQSDGTVYLAASEPVPIYERGDG